MIRTDRRVELAAMMPVVAWSLMKKKVRSGKHLWIRDILQYFDLQTQTLLRYPSYPAALGSPGCAELSSESLVEGVILHVNNGNILDQ